ncbi:MAG: DUF2092 domain-containing protein [Phycisphaerales bacterium]|nr:MAG: DUF2092 domain-containing protein [Phycisphaerales bacterium]
MMLKQRWISAGLAGLAACAVAHAADKGEGDNFETYSPRARAIIEKMAKTVERLRSYEDQATFRMETDATSFAQEAQDVSFVYMHPNRFRVKSQIGELACDGEQVTIYMKHMRRYKVVALTDDKGQLETLVSQHSGAMGMSVGNGYLILSKTPQKKLAKHFRNLDVTGRDSLDGDRCLVLEGLSAALGAWADRDVPATIWMRELDGLVRRVELDFSEMMKEQMKASGASIKFEEYRFVYDVGELRLNEKLDADRFAFEPPSGAKKVEEFHSTWLHTADGAARFELSGKSAPDFELETVHGEIVSRSNFEGKVGVVAFLSIWDNRRLSPGFDELQKLHETYEGQGLVVIGVMRGNPAKETLVEKLEEAGVTFPVATDPGGDVISEFRCDRGQGLVLIGKSGAVQGRYVGFLNEQTASATAKDIEKLLGGEELGGAKPLTDTELEELEDQYVVHYAGANDVEPLNEDWLHEAWAVRALSRHQQYWNRGSGPRGDDLGLWVRHRDRLRQVRHDGEVVAEIAVGEMTADQFGQSTFVAGHVGVGGGLGAVLMKPIQGEEEQHGYRPPVGATFTAVDKGGQELWSLEVQGKQHQLPQHIFLADLDGRRGDELVFVYGQAIHVVDGKGEVRVRKACEGWAAWMVVEDRDRDNRAEIYLRTSGRLQRFDYRPGR